MIPIPPRGTRCMFTMMAGRERKGAWVPGDPQIAFTIMGGTDLDLTRVNAREVNLTLFTLMGGVEVVVPHGAEVDLDGFILMGATEDNVNRDYEADSETAEPRMKVRIRSWGAMGGCEVRSPKRLPVSQRPSKPVAQKNVPQKTKLRMPPREKPFRNLIIAMYMVFIFIVTLNHTCAVSLKWL